MTYAAALRYLRACFPTAAALSRFLTSVAPGERLGVTPKEVQRWLDGKHEPQATRREHVVTCAEALKRERAAGLNALVAARQGLTVVQDQKTLRAAQAEAERVLRLIDERFLAQVKTLDQSSIVP